jgi:hypothetical protein
MLKDQQYPWENDNLEIKHLDAVIWNKASLILNIRGSVIFVRKVRLIKWTATYSCKFLLYIFGIIWICESKAVPGGEAYSSSDRIKEVYRTLRLSKIETLFNCETNESCELWSMQCYLINMLMNIRFTVKPNIEIFHTVRTQNECTEIAMDTVGFADKRKISCVNVEVHVISETSLLYLINVHL